MEEEGDEQLTASDYASDMDVEEDVDVGTLTSMQRHQCKGNMSHSMRLWQKL